MASLIPTATGSFDNGYINYNNSEEESSSSNQNIRVPEPPKPVLRQVSAGAIPSRGQKPPTMSSCSTDFLYEQGYTKGLIKALEKNKEKFPLKIWIIDNSDSMSNGDGHMITESSCRKYVEFKQCTRWEEMQQTVDYHSQMAAILNSTSVFRMLNDPKLTGVAQQFTIGMPSKGPNKLITKTYQDLELAMLTMTKARPTGNTPLNSCLQNIRDNMIQLLVPKLQENNCHQKIAIIIATDGIPTDDQGKPTPQATNEFCNTLLSLANLPVWIVIRLCTDDDNVVNYWNNFDVDGFEMEVIDDFVSEAKEVYEYNKWINYALPLHRMREMGFHDDIFDLLDERPLTKTEVRSFVNILFGTSVMKKAPPSCEDDDWDEFCEYITEICLKEKMQWNPITEKVEPWVNVKKLKRQFEPKRYNKNPVKNIIKSVGNIIKKK